MTPDPETTELFDTLWDARLARVNQELERIANTAYWLGRKLAKHEITRSDVNLRLEGLCTQRPIDNDDWVPCDMAEATAAAGLRRGLGGTT